MKKNKPSNKATHWSMGVFLLFYGAFGLGLSAWFLTQIIHYFLLHTFLLFSTSIVSLLALIVVGALAVLIKLRRGSLERDYFKQYERYEKLRHGLLLRKAFIFSAILMIVCLIISFCLGYYIRIDWLGTVIAFVLCIGVIYCWELWAVYCCQRFFSGFHPPTVE